MGFETFFFSVKSDKYIRLYLYNSTLSERPLSPKPAFRLGRISIWRSRFPRRMLARLREFVWLGEKFLAVRYSVNYQTRPNFAALVYFFVFYCFQGLPI